MADPAHERSNRSPADLDKLDQEKQVAGQAALRWVRDGMTVGLGSGTTAAHFIRALGERMRGGSLAVEAVVSSRQSGELAREAGIPLTEPRRGLRLNLTVDGADEISPPLDLLKGRGGALLREKVLVEASRYFLVIADSSKLVPRLGVLPVPLEALPFALPWVEDRIEALGGQPSLRMQAPTSEKPYLTDQQNFVVDCTFASMDDPAKLAQELDEIPGVVGHGLFLGCAKAAVIGRGNETWVCEPGRAPVPLADFAMPF